MVLILLLLAVASAADPLFVDATLEAGLDHPTVSGEPATSASSSNPLAVARRFSTTMTTAISIST